MRRMEGQSQMLRHFLPAAPSLQIPLIRIMTWLGTASSRSRVSRLKNTLSFSHHEF